MLVKTKDKDTRLWNKGEKTVPFLTKSKKVSGSSYGDGRWRSVILNYLSFVFPIIKKKI